MARKLIIAGRLTAVLAAVVASSSCAAGPSVPETSRPPTLEARRAEPAPRPSSPTYLEAGLPSACERAERKLALATKLGADGFTERAIRLLEQAGGLCPATQSTVRGKTAGYREASAAAARGVGVSADEIWAASASARDSGDAVRARRLAALATKEFQTRGSAVTTWSGVANISVVALSQDGSTLLGRSDDGALLLLDTRKLAPKVILDVEIHQNRREVSAARFSPGGSQVALLEQGSLVLYDSSTGARGKQLQWADHEIQAFAFAPDGASVYTGSRAGFDAVVRRFDLHTGDSIAEYRVVGGREVSALAVSTSGALVAIASRTAGVELLDGKKLTKLRSLGKPAPGDAPEALAFSPAGDRLASIASRTSLEIWNTTSGAPVAHATLERPWSQSILGFSRDGARVRVTGGTWGDALVEIEATTGRALTAKKLPRGSAVLSADGEVLAMSDRSEGVAVVEAESAKVLVEAQQSRGSLEALAITDGHLAVARELRDGTDTRIEIFVEGARSGSARFLTVPGYKATMAFSRLGQRLAGSFGGRSVRAWEVQSGKPLELPDAPEWVDQLAFASPNVLRAGGGPFELKLFSAEIGGRVWTTELEVERGRGGRALFISGDHAALVAKEGITLFEFGKKRSRPFAVEKDVRALALSDDAKVLISVSPRGTERWSLPSGEPKRLLSGRCKDGPARVSADASTVLVRCSYRELVLLTPSGEVSVPWDVGRAELSPSGQIVVTEKDGRVRISGRDLRERASLELAATPGAVIARGPSGELERFGGEPTLSDRAYCRVGNRLLAIELCEDVLYRDDLVRDALVP